MSEYIGMSIEIGGNLPKGHIEEFLSLINDEISEIGGPTNETELRAESRKNGPVSWNGISNYGLCDNLMAFCQTHDLSYHHHCDAKYEYDAFERFWMPGMKLEINLASDQDGDPKIDIPDIRPICDLMLAVIKDGDKALPLFVGNDRLEQIVEKALKNPKRLHQLLVKQVNRLLPVIPELPAFRII